MAANYKMTIVQNYCNGKMNNFYSCSFWYTMVLNSNGQKNTLKKTLKKVEPSRKINF